MNIQRLSRRDFISIGALIFATAILFGFVLRFIILEHHARDYTLHIYFAQMLVDGQLYIIHIVFQILVVIVSLLPFIGFDTAAYLIIIAFYSLTTMILYTLIRTVTQNRIVAVFGALVLILVAPITFFTWSRNNLYFGYVGINVIHNPTMILLKPLALLGFIYALRAFNGTMQFSWRNVILGAILITVSMFTKPNFALVLLPALVLVMAYRYLQGERTGIRLLVMGLIIPMLIVLPVQYLLQYSIVAESRAGGLALAPFATIYLYEQSFWWIAIKFVLSIAFPLVVTVLYRKSMRDNLGVALAWWAFLAGWAQMVLFGEVGEHALDANFWWSAQIGLFLLFVYTTLHWIQQFRREPRAWVSMAIFALHLISGIALIVATLRAVSESSIW